jgi:Holliday junction resolvasome RuvABC ATP-dependent DNA helicase subunit
MGYAFAEQDCGTIAKSTSFEKMLFSGLVTLSGRDVPAGHDMRAVPTYVLLDEAHNLPENLLQQMLKPMLEDKVICEDGSIIYIGDVTFAMATTNSEMLPDALISRCRNNWRLERYTPAELSLMIRKITVLDQAVIEGRLMRGKFHVILKEGLAMKIAERARFTPRIAKESIAEGFYNYCRQQAEDPYQACTIMTEENLDEYFELNGIYEDGITIQDIAYLRLLCENKKMGLAAIASYMELGKKVVEQDIEPFLRYKKFIQAVPGGRALTHQGRQFLMEFDERAELRRQTGDSINMAMMG